MAVDEPFAGSHVSGEVKKPRAVKVLDISGMKTNADGLRVAVAREFGLGLNTAGEVLVSILGLVLTLDGENEMKNELGLSTATVTEMVAAILNTIAANNMLPEELLQEVET